MTKGKTNRDEVAHVEKAAPDRKQAAVQFLELVAAGKIDDAYQRFTVPDGKHHNPFYAAGFPALRKGMKESHAQFPKMRLAVQQVIGEGDGVAVHSHIVLRPGEAGLAAVHLFRFQGHRIVELWDMNQPIPAQSPNPDGMF